jgi:lysophospholipase L1-like esterase
MMRKAAPYRSRLALSLAALVLGCLAAEGALQLGLGRRPSTEMAPSDIPGVLMENRKSYRYPADLQTAREANAGPGFGMVQGYYEINSWGFRGPEFKAEDLAEKKVVLCLGDSTTFGVLVDEPLTFPRRLEQALRARRRPRAMVVNAGVPGYNSWNEDAYLERLLPRLRPKLVVLGLFMNDNVPDGRFDRLRFAIESHSLLAFNVLSLIDGIHERGEYQAVPDADPLWSALDPDTRHAVAEYGKAIGMPRFVADTVRTMDDLNAWDAALERVAHMKSISERNGAKFLCLILPASLQFEPGYRDPEPQRHIQDFLKSRSISYVDMRPAFAEAFSRRIPIYFSKYDVAHFNANGHHLVADNLLEPVETLLGDPR